MIKRRLQLDKMTNKIVKIKLQNKIKYPFECMVEKSWDWEINDKDQMVKREHYNIYLETKILKNTIYTGSTGSESIDAACEWVLVLFNKDLKKYNSQKNKETYNDIFNWLRSQLWKRGRSHWVKNTKEKYQGWASIGNKENELQRIMKDSKTIQEAIEKMNNITLPVIM